ncbi:MAG: hypothetical protein R3211_00880 [Balneolaceae bacterium]|nr:hypothetical protein [Balneolaceae bacterium]
MNLILIFSLLAFAAVIGLLVWLRTSTNKKYEIKNSDIVLGLLPVVLILFLSGKIESFEFGDLKVKAAFEQASSKEIDKQVNLLKGIPVRELETDTKGGVSKIPQLIKNKTESLEFRLGYGGYYSSAIRDYFEALRSHSLLKYVIVNNSDGTFFGMFEADLLINYLEAVRNETRYREFENFLNQANGDALTDLPGYIGADKALDKEANRNTALSAMESSNLNFLPVVDDTDMLQGIVERSRLTASLILDVTKQLSSNQ